MNPLAEEDILVGAETEGRGERVLDKTDIAAGMEAAQQADCREQAVGDNHTTIDAAGLLDATAESVPSDEPG